MSEATAAAPKRPDEIRLALEVEKFRQEKALSLPGQTYFKGIAPSDILNQIMAFCEGIQGSRFIPESYRNDVPSIFFVVNVAKDLGLQWTHAIRQLYMTPAGKVGMEGGVMLALLQAKHFRIKILRSDTDVAEYWVKRPGGDDAFEWSCPITWDMAKEQGWPYTSKGDIKAPWKDRANMLRYRSLAATARVVAADVLGGIYLPDELDGIDMERDGEGTYTSKREQAEAAADKQAEDDPKYEIKRKTIETVAAAELHKNHGHANWTEFRDANVLSPTEARTEQFLKDRAEAPFTPEVVAEPNPILEEVAAKIRSMSENTQIPIAHLSGFVVGYLGDTEVGPENVSGALNTLGRMLEDEGAVVRLTLRDNPEELGADARRFHDKHLPWVPKKKASSKAKAGAQQTL